MQSPTGGPRADLGLSSEEIREMLLHPIGSKIKHRVEVLDHDDQPTGEELPVNRRAGGFVQWDYRSSDPSASATTDTIAVRRKAKISLTEHVTVNVLARRFRTVTYVMHKSGVWVPFYLGVFRSVLPDVHDDGVIRTRTLDLTDKTGRWYDKTISTPREVLEDDDVVQMVKDDLLDVFGEAVTTFPTPISATLDEPLFFDVNTPYLAVWNRCFKAIGLGQVIADEAGRPTAQKLSDLANKGSEWTYGPGAGKIVRAGTRRALIPNLPNVLKFISRRGPTLPEIDNGIVYKYNQSSGPGSIDARGEEIETEISTDAYNHPELEAIAAAEAQRYFAGGGDRFEGEIALNPLHSDQDVATFNRSRLELPNMLSNIVSWTYPLSVIDDTQAVLMKIAAERRVGVTDS